jgi:quinol monooxygenase YgiN
MLKQLLIVGASMVTSSFSGNAPAADEQGPYVRMAELEVEPTQLENFKSAAKEVGESSVRAEPGCLVLYAVSEKDNPSRIRVFEIYRDMDAYGTHVHTTHFLKFRATTDTMVKSRKLIDMMPISLAAKAK